MTSYHGHDVLKNIDTALTIEDQEFRVGGRTPRIQCIITPTGPLTVIRPVAEQLLREGVISGTLDGDLHCTDAAILKGAILATSVCDFCSLVGATNVFDVPDFDMPGVGRSVGGWVACDECASLIRAGKRKNLLQRALDKLAFPKFSRLAIEELFGKFWMGMEEKAEVAGTAAAFADYIEDRLVVPHGESPTPRSKRMDDVIRATGLTRAEAEALTKGTINHDVLNKVAKWHRPLKGLPANEIEKLFRYGPQKPLADILPHWQRALDGQFAALSNLDKLLRQQPKAQVFPEATDLNDPAAIKALLARISNPLYDMGFDEDLRALRAAQAYSFNTETIAAIREASQSIPHDAPLSSIETPNTGAGWFWFAEPLPVASSTVASATTQALLWCWSDIVKDEPAIMFSPYVLDPQTKALGKGYEVHGGNILPSTRWYWPLSMSFHDMIAYNTIRYRDAYGPGAKYEGDTNRMGEKETLDCIAQLSLFFIMSCVWFKQTLPSTAPILTKAPGHIERHARKRMVKEHQLKETPTVQVVALRKTLRTPVEHAEGERSTSAREYHCRWIVAGHPRLQHCGPGNKDRKLIWIDAYPKGPEDKPLRTRKKVFAVVR